MVSGDAGRGEDHLDQLLSRTRAALAATRTAGAAAADDEAAAIVGQGDAADGLVRAVVSAGGLVESITVDPRLLRDGLEVLCGQIVVAVNAAFADLRAQTPAQTAPEVDVEALSANLASLQDQSVRQMAMISQALGDVVARMRQAR